MTLSYVAGGNLRQITGHPYFDQFDAPEMREFNAISVRFTAHNNLPGELAQSTDDPDDAPLLGHH